MLAIFLSALLGLTGWLAYPAPASANDSRAHARTSGAAHSVLPPTKTVANFQAAGILLSPPPATYSATVLGDHPLVYYRLDDSGCCAALDSSGNGLNGTYGTTTVTYGTPGLLAGDANTAITNNGTGTAVARDAGALPSTSARTVEIWESTTNTSWQTLWSYGSFAVNGGFFELSIRPDVHGTVLLFLGGNDDAAFYTPHVIDDSYPHQIAFSYDGAALITFYVDGQQVGQTSLATPLNTVLTGPGLALGNGLDGSFRGVLDEFAMYSAALTPDQVNGHWRAGTAAAACPAAPTTGYAAAVTADHPYRYFRLSDSGLAATDYSGNCRYGVYGGGVPRVAGLLTADADGAIATAAPEATMLVAGLDGSPSTGARTVEVWEQTTNTSWQTFFSYGSISVNGGYFQLSSRPDGRGTLLYFNGQNDDASFYTPYVLDDGAPHQIALSYDGSRVITFYMDGQQIGQTSLATPLNTVLTGQPFLLGNGGDQTFRGALDELAIYSTALSADQVNSHWRAGTAASACPATPTTGYAAAVVADHPSRYFRLGDTGQSAADFSGSCRYASYPPGVPRVAGLLVADPDGGIASSTPPRIVLSASMDGSPSTGARTVELWEQTTNTSWQALLSYGTVGVTGGYFQISIRPDGHGTILQFIGWGADTGFYTPYVINDGYPHQIALSYDGTAVLTFYVDGQQFGQASLTTPLNTALGGQPLVLSGGLDGPFNGFLDELSLYPAALSAAQVNAHYLAGAVPPGYSLLGGTVTSGGNSLAGARPEACPTTGGSCFFALPSGPGGGFHVAVPNGSYTITVFPPVGPQFSSPVTVGPYTVPPSITNLAISFNVGLPPSGTFVTPAGSTTGTVPRASWTQPSTYTVSGCVGGFGELLMQTFNTSTGQPQTVAISLDETPVNSGTYVARIPALAPLHGITSVTQWILCLGKTAVLPDGGNPAGGTHVLLGGNGGFTGATGVSFGSSPAQSFQVINDGVIEAVSPVGTGTVTISVTTASGSTIAVGNYTYLEVTGISPSTGPSAGATVVTITGQGFTNVKGVIFGLLRATSFHVDSTTQITAVAPAGLGTIDVQVANGFAVTDAVGGSLFAYQGGPPGSSSINEGTGPTAQDVLAGDVLGSHFCDAAKQATTITNIDFGQMCEGAMMIINRAGPTGVLKGKFIAALFVIPAIIAAYFFLDYATLAALTTLVLAYWPVLVLLLALFLFWYFFIDPDGTVVDATGNAIDGATVTIEGQVSGGSYAPVAPSSGVILPATNPEVTNVTGAFNWDALAGSYLIQASKAGCHAPGAPSQPSVSTPPFVLPPPVIGLILTLECPGSTASVPTVTYLFPTFGTSAGGTQVEISGTGLADNPSVTFGSTPAQSVTVLSPYSIVAIAPPGTSTVDVTVTTSGGTSATGAGSKYGYYTPAAQAGAPTVTSVNPSSGPQAGGNLVKIFGTGLSGAFGVAFGSFSAFQVTNVSPTELDVIVPAGAGNGPVSITVSTANGDSAPGPAAVYTYGALPNRSTATTLSSSVNPSAIGTAITLTATVAAPGGGTPTGVVTFIDTSTGRTMLGTATLSTSGGVTTATLNTSLLSIGSHSLTAGYGGDSSFNASYGALTQVVNPGPLEHLVVSPATGSIAAGASQIYMAEGFDQYGNSLGDVTSATTFNIGPDGTCSSATCTATVAGAHTVTGADASKTGTASLTVNAGALDSLVLSPATDSITAGGSLVYMVEGFDHYNNDLGNVTSSTTFTIAPDGSCNGATCTATVATVHTVTGTAGTKTGTATVSVNAGALDHLVLNPASSSITAGASQAYTATGSDQYGNSLGDLTSATTFSIGPDGTCSSATCTATLVGAHTVTGTAAGKTGTASLTINAGALDRLVLSPATGSITAGGSQVYTAEGFDHYNNDLGTVTSSTTFSIAPDGICSGATCTATVAGAHTVTGTVGGKSATASLTVNAGALDHLVLLPGSASITAGASQAYTATGSDQYGNSLGDVTSATTFTIGLNGTCTFASCTATVAGAHTVNGTDSGRTGTASLTVNAGPLDHLVVSPTTGSITAGGSQVYMAEGFDHYNNDLGNVTSSTTFTLTPDGSCSGLTCTATVAGVHTVTGADGTKTGTATLTVNAGALDHLVLNPASSTIAAGGSQAYTATGFDRYNNDLGNATSSTTFGIAPDGSCTGATCTATVAGVHTVTGTDGGKTGTATLTVNATVDLRLALSITPATATNGTVVTASASLTNTASVSRSVTLVATFTYVSPTGQTTTVTSSTTTITLAAGQTVARSFTFKVSSYIPRGTYMFTATASDVTGSVNSSTTFKVT